MAIRKKQKIGAGDFQNLSLLMKAFGGICLLPGLLLLLAPQCWIVSLILVGIGLLFIIPGIGLGRYRAWAWYAAVFLLVPINILGSIVGCVLIIIYPIEWRGPLEIATIVAMAFSGLYVCQALLSKEGRERFQSLSSAVKNRETKSGEAAERAPKNR